MPTSAAAAVTAETIFALTALPLDRPRAIDDVIDYFGESPRPRDGRRPRRVDVLERW